MAPSTSDKIISDKISDKITELENKRNKLLNKQTQKLSKLGKTLPLITTPINFLWGLKNDVLSDDTHTNLDINWNDYFDNEGNRTSTPLPQEYAPVGSQPVSPWLNIILQIGLNYVSCLNIARAINDYKTDNKKAKLAGKIALHAGIPIASMILSYYFGQNEVTQTYDNSQGTNITTGSITTKSYGPAAIISGTGLGLESILLFGDYIGAKRLDGKISKVSKQIESLKQYESLFKKVTENPTEDNYKSLYKSLGEAIIIMYPLIKKEKAIKAVFDKYKTEIDKNYVGKKFKKKYTQLAGELYDEFTIMKLGLNNVLELMKKINGD